MNRAAIRTGYALSGLIVAGLGVCAGAALRDDSVAATRVSGENQPNDWIGFHSRKTKANGNPLPKLLVAYEDGQTRSYTPAADAVVISYLGDKNWGHMPVLAIDLSDRNRVLLLFERPAQGRIRKAELTLQVCPGDHPTPALPFDLGIYEVKEDWKEFEVTWDSQPKCADYPSSKARVDPRAKELRIDVTPLVRRNLESRIETHGWLLKVPRPLKGNDSPLGDRPEPGEGREPGAKVEKALLALFPWTDSVGQAIERARREKKLILACVRSHYDSEKTSYLEQMLLAAMLSDPDVHTLIQERFVPVRVCYPPWVATIEQGSGDNSDPLTPLGLLAREAKATALIVSDGKSAVARLTNLGTFDRDLALKFLLDALAGTRPPDGVDDPWKLLTEGYLDDAQRLFARLDSREGKYGLARVASLRGNHSRALNLCLPVARSDGAFQHEAKVEAARSLVRLDRLPEAVPLLQTSAVDTRGSRAAEASYLLGCVLYRTAKPETARAIWRNLVANHTGSLSAVRAQTRLAWPEAMAMYENLTMLGRTRIPETSGPHADRGRSREESQAVDRGLDYLLGQQYPDGTWTTGSQVSKYRVAVTSLVARTLHAWAGKLERERRERVDRATAKATLWLNEQVKRLDPTTMDSFGAAYLLDYFLDLAETKAPVQGDVAGAVQLLLAGQCPNGAWSYDHQFAANWAKYRDPKLQPGRTHSMNTGLALLALARAKRLGFAVDAKSLEKGVSTLIAMRDGPGVYTYIYPGPRNFNQVDSSIARGPLCEHALFLLGAVGKEDLGIGVQQFLKNREGLRAPLKVWGPTWLPPHGYTSYFFFFAYDHAARAIVDVGDKSRERLQHLRTDLLRLVEPDGTWLDYESIGKPYGTAMALHVLYLARTARESAGSK
jgi:hypothetical protein